MVIWIDGKNPALYSSGISLWLQSVLRNLSQDNLRRTALISPKNNKMDIYSDLEISRILLPWSRILPRKLNHILYDKITFRFATFRKRPQKVFSPYFDVNCADRVQNIITVHDLCFIEVPELYPKFLREYYTYALKRNIKKASRVVTVSESSKKALIQQFNLTEDSIYVIPNVLDDDFVKCKPLPNEIAQFKASGKEVSARILYTSGIENRKNIERLCKALCQLVENGLNFELIVTGENIDTWNRMIEKHPLLLEKFRFLGFISVRELKVAYLASDVVVFPSLSEGFGRACLESMSTGIPLACSNLPVFQEISGNYAEFFSPYDSVEMAKAILAAIYTGKRDPISFPELKDSSGFKSLESYLYENASK